MRCRYRSLRVVREKTRYSVILTHAESSKAIVTIHGISWLISQKSL